MISSQISSSSTSAAYYLSALAQTEEFARLRGRAAVPPIDAIKNGKSIGRSAESIADATQTSATHDPRHLRE